MKVFIVGGGHDYTRMFLDRGWELASSLNDADLVQFTGGADVTPEIYGEKNTQSHNDFNRDLREAGVFAIAQRMGIPMTGICRGGQFLNVMCGGKMIQHVEGHAIHGTHYAFDNNGDTYSVTSTHHQMMQGGDGSIVEAWGTIVGKYDPEVIHYPNKNVLCFQPHPEFPGYKECQDYYFELLERCLGLRVIR